jgi:hypothetical protein
MSGVGEWVAPSGRIGSGRTRHGSRGPLVVFAARVVSLASARASRTGRLALVRLGAKPARRAAVVGRLENVCSSGNSGHPGVRPGCGQCRDCDRDRLSLRVHMATGCLMSGFGTIRSLGNGQSMSALPRQIRRQLVPLSLRHHRPQCRDTGRCFRSWCGRAGVVRLASCRCDDRSGSPWFA